MSRDIIIAFAFTFGGFAERFLALRIKIFVLFEAVVTKAFGLWTNHLALCIVAISPTQI